MTVSCVARWFLLACLGAVVAIAAPGVARAERIVQWSAPAQLRVVPWPSPKQPDRGQSSGGRPEAGQSAAASFRLPTEPVLLAPKQLLLVPVRSGDVLEIQGVEFRVGYGSGSGELPDAIAWERVFTKKAQLRVPSWGYARFLVVECSEPQALRVRVGVASTSFLAFQRVDRQVFEFLLDQGPVPRFEESSERDAVLALVAQRDALLDAIASSPNTRAALGDALARWLTARWLIHSYQRRALARPYFLPHPVQVGGAADRVGQADAAVWEVPTGGSLELSAPGADVVSASVEAWAGQNTQYQILRGSELAREITHTIPERAQSEDRWTSPKLTRVVLTSDAKLRVRVTRGKIRVGVRSYRAQTGLLEAAAQRSVTGLLQAARRAVRQLQLGADGELLEALIQGEVRSEAEAHAVLARHLEREPRAGLRAVLASVWLPRADDEASLVRVLEDFRVSSAALPLEARRALRSWVLEQLRGSRTLLRLSTAQRDAALGAWLADSRGMSAERMLTYRAQLESLFPPGDSARSNTTERLEERAARTPEREDWKRLARAAWRRITPWTTLEADAEALSMLHWQPPLPDDPSSGECEFEGSTGLRWSMLSPASRSFAIAPEIGTHVVVPLLALPHRDQALASDAVVSVSGEHVSVLSLLGRPSHVALRRGTHQFSLLQGQQVLARIPAQGRVACDSLREARRWYLLSGSVRFALPAGPAATVASLVARADSVPRAGAKLQLAVGGVQRSAWIAPPATGAIEIPIAPNASEIVVTSEQPLLVRLRIRRHRDPSVTGTPRSSSSVRKRSPHAVVVEDPAETFASKLSRLRELTRRLRSSESVEGATRLRAERAGVLFALGQPTFARLDLERRVGPVADVIPELLPPGERWWPHRGERALALGRAARLPLLPDDAAAGVLAHVAAQLQLRRDAAALTTLLTQARSGPVGRSALVLAILLEEAQRFGEAAALYEQLATQTGNVEAFTAAAECRTKQAAASSDLDLTLQARLVAQRAIAAGARPAPLLAPLWGTVDFTTPSLSALGRGVVSLDVWGTPAAALSENEAVVAALTDMPESARSFTGPTRVSLRALAGRRLAVTQLCYSKSGLAEECAVVASVDGAPIPCPTWTEQLGAARAKTCEFDIPEGARNLAIAATTEREHTGWIAINQLSAAGWQVVPSRVRYARIGEDVPAVFSVRGPSLLRLRARGAGRTPSAILVGVQTQISETPLWQSALPTQRDLFARYVTATEEPGIEIERTITIERAGLQHVTIRARGGDLLIRPALATVVEPAHLEPPEPEISAIVAQGAGVDAWDGFDFSSPREPRAGALASSSAELALVDADLQESDDDRGDRYLEASAFLRKALIPQRLWSKFGVLARMRDGPGSFGVDAAATLSAVGYVPGAFARARVMFQSADAGLGMGYRVAFGAYERAQWSPSLAQLTGAVVTVRGVDARLQDTPGRDADVYSNYGAEHPYSVDLNTTLVHRPFFDTLSRHTASLRLNPGLSEVDRVELASASEWLGGSGFAPWVSWQTVVGYRPRNSTRDDPFFRFWTAPEATWWHWFSTGHRLRASTQLGAYVDVPLQQPALSWFGVLVLGYDFLGPDGLEDFSLSERPHRERLEEGSGRVVTESPRVEPLWVME